MQYIGRDQKAHYIYWRHLFNINILYLQHIMHPVGNYYHKSLSMDLRSDQCYVAVQLPFDMCDNYSHCRPECQTSEHAFVAHTISKRIIYWNYLFQNRGILKHDTRYHTTEEAGLLINILYISIVTISL